MASDADITPLTLAYLRARQADPLCSFGDFSAVSDVVDVATANYLKTCVSVSSEILNSLFQKRWIDGSMDGLTDAH